MIHPLLNAASTHYQDEKSAIELLEETATLGEQIGWCKGNIFKYKYRQDKKGQKESDLIKIKTYEDYLQFLSWCSFKISKDIICKDAYKSRELNIIYQL